MVTSQPGKDQEVVSLREIIYFSMVPEAVVIGYAHPIQSDTLGLLDQVIGIEKAVHGCGVGVCMDVYYQVWSTNSPKLHRSIVESVTEQSVQVKGQIALETVPVSI